MVEICPATARLPLRSAPLLAATVNVTAEGPLPCAGDVTVTQGAWLTAIHGHPVEVVSVSVPPPAAALSDRALGAREYAQGAPEPGAEVDDCVNVTVCPAT